MPNLRIGSRGQITIPSDLRRELHLEEGAQLMAQVRDGELVLRPASRSIVQLRGSVSVGGPQDFAAIRANAAERRVRRMAGESDCWPSSLLAELPRLTPAEADGFSLDLEAARNELGKVGDARE